MTENARPVQRAATAAALATLLCACGSGRAPAATATSASTASTSPSLLPSTQLVRMQGISMAPTLKNGDIVAVDRQAYAAQTPQRGDIVVFAEPGFGSGDFVKRIIGVPGDTLEIDTTAGATGVRAAHVFVAVAGSSSLVQLVEPYLPANDTWLENGYCCDRGGHATVAAQPFTLSQGVYFTLGDNRNVSEDSRAFGPVPVVDIRGKVLFRTSPGPQNIYALLPSLGGG